MANGEWRKEQIRRIRCDKEGLCSPIGQVEKQGMRMGWEGTRIKGLMELDTEKRQKRDW